MNHAKTSRPFQERFLDGYHRSQLLRDVQKKYAPIALGVSLALGGAVPRLDSPQWIRANTRFDPPSRSQKIVIRGLAYVSEEIRADFFLKQVPFGAVIYNEAKKNHVSPELVAAVARAESSFHPTARSQRGAIGLMQLVPRTGYWLGATDLFDPIQNIVAGTKYLGYLSDRFGGNEDHVIAAYNAGEGNVRRFNGVPPFRETRDYVQRVRRFQQDLRARMKDEVAGIRTPQRLVRKSA